MTATNGNGRNGFQSRFVLICVTALVAFLVGLIPSAFALRDVANEDDVAQLRSELADFSAANQAQVAALSERLGRFEERLNAITDGLATGGTP